MKKNSDAKHLGRNPFGKKKPEQPIKEVKTEKIETVALPQRLRSKIADWILVDLPAGSYVFGLKTVLFTKSLLEKKN